MNFQPDYHNLILYALLIVSMIIGAIVFTVQYKKLKRVQFGTNKKFKQAISEKMFLTTRQEDVNQSLRYAYRLLNSLLPPSDYINTIYPESFVLHRSKEIVGGDFYWITKSNNKTFIGAFDSTGHGIPGSFLSIIGLMSLKDIFYFESDKWTTPAEILNQLGRELHHIFSNDENIKDGMDASIIAINKKKNKIEFAGAVNKLFIVRDDEIHEHKGDKYSISPDSYNMYGSYTNYTINVRPGDMLYLFSDGYTDQFGGPDGKKFKYRRFRHMLLSNYQKPVKEQLAIYNGIINSWIGRNEQIDDILLIGIKI